MHRQRKRKQFATYSLTSTVELNMSCKESAQVEQTWIPTSKLCTRTSKYTVHINCAHRRAANQQYWCMVLHTHNAKNRIYPILPRRHDTCERIRRISNHKHSTSAQFTSSLSAGTIQLRKSQHMFAQATHVQSSRHTLSQSQRTHTCRKKCLRLG